MDSSEAIVSRETVGFIRLRQNTLRLAAGMNGKVNRAEAHQSEGGLAMAQFRLIPHRLRRGASFFIPNHILRKSRVDSGSILFS